MLSYYSCIRVGLTIMIFEYSNKKTRSQKGNRIMAQKINIAGARITFKNFAGRPTDWNKKGGARDFAVVLDTYEDVQALIDMGFSVKYFKKKEETDPDVPFLKVKVNFRYNDDGSELLSPHIYMINNNKKVLITPQTAQILDQADIAYCDIVIRPYYYEVQGKAGVAAYLDKMYVNIEQDEFEKKYEMYNDPEEEEAEEIPFE